MRSVNVLWADDDWALESPQYPELQKWRSVLESRLASAGLNPTIHVRPTTKIADDLVRRNYDLLILDYEFSKDPGGENAFSLGTILGQTVAKTKIPPMVIFSRYSHIELEARAKVGLIDRIYAVCLKSDEGLAHLVECATGLFATKPLNFVVMSDLHFGYLESTSGMDPSRFFNALKLAISDIKREHKIDGLFACGDFAWTSQKADFTEATRRIWDIARQLELDPTKQLFLCPGNHDIDFSDGTPSWKAFELFLDSLFNIRNAQSRFPCMNAPYGSTPLFERQHSLFSVVKNEVLGIVVVALNSNHPTGHGVGVQAKIDEAQWDALEQHLSNNELYPKNLLRIAILHHPVFSPPGGIDADEPHLLDQGKALHVFAKCGISLVFHGHTHFSGIHSHRIALINSAGSQGQQQEPHIVDLLTVACPTLIAHPSSVSPQRHFLVVKLDAVDQRTGTRAFSQESYIFQPADCRFVQGQSVSVGYFKVGSN